MSFSYAQLWHTLSKMNLSKTDFRLKTGISTATLAKLSNNQPVALDVIGKICESLNCRMDEVVTYQPDSDHIEKWHTLVPDTTYNISLWFLKENDTMKYFYGFTVPYRTSFDSSKWTLKKICSEDRLAIWQVSGFIGSSHVRSLLEDFENNKTLGEFLKHSGILLSCSKTNAEIHAARLLDDTLLGTVSQCYRPAFLLEPAAHTVRLRPDFQPFHSYDESEPMLCESITCLNKKDLYETDGEKDEQKMALIFRFFRETRFGRISDGGLIDIARIGNFELFSWLSGTPESEAVFEYEIIKEESDQKDAAIRMTGIQVTLHSQHLNGEYLLEADAWNANNLVLKEIRQITCTGEDILQFFPLQECCSEVGIYLWQRKGAGQAVRLMGARRVPLIRDIYCTTSIQGKHGILEDAWTAAGPKKGKRSRNNRFSYQTSETRHIGSPAYDPWRSENRRVFQDFNDIYGTETAEGAFFPEGWEHHEDFLEYFKKILAQSNTAHVLIIDPFIDQLAISRILRSIKENRRVYEIITDFQAGRVAEDKRIEELSRTCDAYRSILPNHFIVSGINESKPLLHDRYLILIDSDGKSTVYQMSNSLDNTAISHASSIVKADRRTSARISAYYRKLIEDCREKGTLTLIFDNTEKSRSKSLPVDEHLQKRKDLLQHFNQLLTAHSLPELSLDEQEHITFADGQTTEQLACIAAAAPAAWSRTADLLASLLPPFRIQLEQLLKQSSGAELIPVLSEYLISASPEDIIKEKRDYEYSTAISLGQAIQREEFPGLLDICDVLLDYRYDHLQHFSSFAFRYAAEFLSELSLADFEMCLKTSMEKKGLASAECRTALLFVSLLPLLEPYRNNPDDFAVKLLSTSLPVLRALSIEWHICRLTTRPEEFVQTLRSLSEPEEQNFAMTQMAVRLQIQVCRHHQAPEEWQGYLDNLKCLWPSMQSAPMDRNTMEKYFEPLRMRSIPDICDLIWQMYQSGRTDESAAADYLTELAFHKSAELQMGKDVILQTKDLQDCDAIFNRLFSLNLSYVETFRDRLVKLVKNILRILRDPFLRSRDHRSWKQNADLLCWCCCIRIFLQKNGITDQADALFQEAEIILENNAQTLKESSELYCNYIYLQEK